jgi:DnaJ-class molecular chaperone
MSTEAAPAPPGSDVCPTCKGHGKVRKYVRATEPQGLGSVEWPTCSVCGGTGLKPNRNG